VTAEDYKLVARVFAQARQDLNPNPDGDIEFGFSVLQERLADAMKAQNHRFRRGEFDAACKP
jgi:hypothetical protein